MLLVYSQIAVSINVLVPDCYHVYHNYCDEGD